MVEAGYRSGKALITARCAAEQGRDVFVVPGSIFSYQSRGCHLLLKEGARLVESMEDLLAEYGIVQNRSSSPAGSSRGSKMGSPLMTAGNDVKGLSPMEKTLLELLSCIPVSVDELAEASGMPVDRLAETLLSLELKGENTGYAWPTLCRLSLRKNLKKRRQRRKLPPSRPRLQRQKGKRDVRWSSWNLPRNRRRSPNF